MYILTEILSVFDRRYILQLFPFFSCSQGFVRVHEVLVRNFTTILDGLVGGSEAVLNEARDPYGGLNIIIPSLDRETLQCLTEMLYRSRRHLLNRILTSVYS